MPVRGDVFHLSDLMGTRLATITALWHSFVVHVETHVDTELDLPLCDPRLSGNLFMRIPHYGPCIEHRLTLEDDDEWNQQLERYVIPDHLRDDGREHRDSSLLAGFLANGCGIDDALSARSILEQRGSLPSSTSDAAFACTDCTKHRFPL